MTLGARTLISVLIGATMASACTGEESPGQKLDIAVNLFNHSVRWGNVNAAAAYIPAAKKEAWVKRRRRLAESVVILDYEVVEVRHAEMTALSAEVTVTVEWRPKNSNVVEMTTLLQKWRYIDTEKRWEMDEQSEVEKDGPEDLDEPAGREPDSP